LPNARVFTYRCCGDSKTDSSFTVNDPDLVSDADRARMLAQHAAKIEARHEAKLAVEAHLSSFLKQPVSVAVLSADGLTVQSNHQCSLVSIEHVADEIVRCRYSCCGADRDDWYFEVIDHIPQHTLAEVDQFCQNHMKEAARHCAVRAATAAVPASFPERAKVAKAGL
jgi:hypothetical protein